MVNDAGGERRLQLMRQTIAMVIYPLQQLVDLPARSGRALVGCLSVTEPVAEELERLRQEHLLTAAKLLKMAALETENARLRALLGSASKVGDQVIVAEILSVDLDPFRQTILLDKGARHGLFVGQPLINDRGILGQVVRVAERSAQAMLISDPNHAIPVLINRNSLRTIAFGTGQSDRLVLRFLPNNADVHPGDIVVSSGLAGRFPANYPLAKVFEVRRDPSESFATVYARPTALVDRSREVLLVNYRGFDEESIEWLPSEADDADSATERSEAEQGSTESTANTGAQ